MRKTVLTLAILGAAAFAASAATPPATAPDAAKPPAFWSWQETPAMGWNSWDCFGTGVTEAQTLENADYMDKNLKAFGWNIITVDIQWYEPRARGTGYRANAVLEMDANGRLLPAPNRFPTSAQGRSFKPLADALHAKGLRFGLHLLRGIPRQAVTQNTPILGTALHAADIANQKDICTWNGDMYGVDMTKPGAQEYYDSVFALLASWDLDFVKVDDLSRPYHTAEIEAIRKAIDKTGRHIVFSTSPGATPVDQGKSVEMNANMWRVSDDFWDTDWRLLQEQFKRLDDWTPYRAPGHFPDADMLPVGNVRAWQQNQAWTKFTQDEQVTMMTLWSIARSPLIIGGNLPKNDEFTLGLLTNAELIKVDQHSTNNRQLFHNGSQYAWVADADTGGSKYVALFNAPAPVVTPRRGLAAPPAATTAPAEATTVSVAIADLKLDPTLKVTNIRDLWSHKDLGAGDTVSAKLLPHAAGLFEVQVGKK